MEIKVNNRLFSNFQDFSLKFKFDSIASTISLDGVFNPSSSFHREVFKPYSYPKYEVIFNGGVVMTGMFLNVSHSLKSSPTTSPLSGYSLPGVLEDCNAPKSVYPLQFNGLSIIQIVEKLCAPFGIVVEVGEEVLNEMNEVLQETEIGESESIKSYIQSLVSQKNAILTHTAQGSLKITRPNVTKNAIQHFENSISGVDISVSYNGQRMHSSILVLKSADEEDNNAAEEEISNPYVSEFRHVTKNQNSGTDNDTSSASRNALSDEIKATRVTISMDRERWLQSGLIMPDSIITVRSPELYLFDRVRFFVEEVTISRKSEEETAILSCVLADVYGSGPVENVLI